MQEPNRHGLPLKLAAAGATDIGRGRKHNEDTVLLRPDLNLFILADGAGGHNAGNVASALATTSIANYFEATEAEAAHAGEVDAFGLVVGERRLATAIQRANKDIIEIAATSNKRKGMGTTVVAVAASGHAGLLHVAHVGDSRCYRLRDGQLELLTQDHSLLNDVLELKPDMDDAALARLPRNVVTRALGMEEPVRVSVRSHRVRTGDTYLLCSDGLTDALDEAQLAEALGFSQNADALVALLIELAKTAGARDNIAAVVIHCEMAPTAPAARRRATPAPSQKRLSAQDESDGPELSTDDSSPEIVIVGHDAEPEVDDGPAIHVVPQESASAGLLDAFDDFVDTMRSAAPPPLRARAPRAPAAARCATCNAPIESDAKVCANCGAARR